MEGSKDGSGDENDAVAPEAQQDVSQSTLYTNQDLMLLVRRSLLFED